MWVMHSTTHTDPADGSDTRAWQVGYYDPVSNWYRSGGRYTTLSAAAAAVHYLNGGSIQHVAMEDYEQLRKAGLVT